MIKKPQDENYRGVDEQKIKNANPKVDFEMLTRYAYYQKERTEIYVKKEIQKLPAPWSSNPMFTDFKFTMTKRWLDRESKNLIEGILKREDISYDNKILNSALFRIINKFKMFDTLPEKYIDFSKPFGYVEQNELLLRLESKNLSGTFSDAYFLSGVIASIKKRVQGVDPEILGGKSSPMKSIIALISYIKEYSEKILEISRLTDPDKMVEELTTIHGMGAFIAYQIFADWTYIKEFPFSDNSCVDCGPGTIRGTDHMFLDKDGLDYKELQYWFRDNIDNLMLEYNIEWDLNKWFYFLPEESRYWGLQDITNSFCEFDKTTRIWDAQGQDENRKRVRKFNGKSGIIVSDKKDELEDW